MQRRDIRWALGTALIFSMAGTSHAANHRTENFIIDAPTAAFAKQVGDNAEAYRKQMAIEWTGQAMPNWSRPCLIKVVVGPQLGAGGATTFMFDRGEVFGWNMTIQGSRERILDSVLPHEITHTVFASHFRQPLPRWADEGGCTTVEHASERGKQEKMLVQFLQTGRGISFTRMFAMKEYPHDVMPLYAQGYTLARYLIGHGGKRKYVDYIGEGLETNDWPATTNKYYGHASLGVLQNQWLEWVRRGMPVKPGPDAATPAVTLASNSQAMGTRRARPTPNLIYRPKPTAKLNPRSKMVPIGSTAAANARAPQPIAKTSAADNGWYAAGRREPVGYGRSSEQVATATKEKTDSQPVTRHVVRPQPPQPARQVIMQWSAKDQPTRTR